MGRNKEQAVERELFIMSGYPEQIARAKDVRDHENKTWRMVHFLRGHRDREFSATEIYEATGVAKTQVRILLQVNLSITVERRGKAYVYYSDSQERALRQSSSQAACTLKRKELRDKRKAAKKSKNGDQGVIIYSAISAPEDSNERTISFLVDQRTPESRPERRTGPGSKARVRSFARD